MFQRKYPLILLVFCLLVTACNSNSEGPGKSRTAEEDELIGRLSGLMVTQPDEQDEIDRNLLINYAIDSLLDVQMTPSGIFYIIENPREGEPPEYDSQVSVHYRGRLLSGKEFDSSYKRGKPLYINVQQVVQGWQHALQMLKPGGSGTFLIPSSLAYGDNGFAGLIPPGSCLRFDMKLVAVHGD